MQNRGDDFRFWKSGIAKQQNSLVVLEAFNCRRNTLSANKPTPTGINRNCMSWALNRR
jgi:hypothetical protein